MVSKLKVSPFHKVNSPLEAPVTNLLPSGVHLTTNTGHFTLKQLLAYFMLGTGHAVHADSFREDSFREVAVSFYCMDPGARTQV